MRFPSLSSPMALLSTTFLALTSLTSATNMITSNSLNPCSANAGFTATLFEVSFFPDNYTLNFNINAVSSISGNVKANIQIIAYGLTIYNQTIDPCTSSELASLCPLYPGTLRIPSTQTIPASIVKNIPTIAYGVPDLDGVVRVFFQNATTSAELACVEAVLSNGKTVDQVGVQWGVAVIAGLGLVTSAVTSGLGHSNTAAHVAANALSLFGFFQAQALIGMTSVELPPIVQSWTQNFQWSMGIVEIDFMQSVLTWYQRATGGTPSTILSNLAVTSVEVQKRALNIIADLTRRGLDALVQRDTTTTATSDSTAQVLIVKGITRVGFRAGIEPTNIFLTGLAFFVAFVVIVVVCVALFKVACEGAVRAGWMQDDKFSDFRNGWKIILKGILFRLVLIGYVQMTTLCLWEFTVRDSPAEVVSALFYFVAISIALAWAAFKVTRIAKRSVAMHKNPAYILYSDPTSLNKWGFLYVQFRATAYYFILPVLLYILCKSIFIAFAQNAPTAQAVGLVVIEALWLIGVSILRPWMDKKTNAFNISIAAINFVNVVFLLIFTGVFNQPSIVTGVMGVVFFVYNAVFALFLLIMVLIASVYAVVSKNPDTRYQPMRDDRGSFIKSQTNLTTELDALGATARGDMRMKRDLDDDSDSFTTNSIGYQQRDAAGVPLPPSAATSTRNVNQYDPPRSPIDPSASFIPSDGGARHGQPGPYSDNPSRNMYSGGAFNNSSGYDRSMHNGSPAPRYNYNQEYPRTGSAQSNTSFRPQNNGGGQWQRGAGYDH